MCGLKFLVNGREIASVSSDGRNIINAYISGDVIGSELATAHMTGGYYGSEEDTSHRIWLGHHIIVEHDEIEVQFLNDVSSSSGGMTIEELADVHANDYEPDEVGEENIHEWLASQPKVRKCFSFEFMGPNNERINSTTSENDHTFHFGVMWKWTNPNEVSVRLSSTTLENMRQKKAGTTHLNLKILSGQSVKLRVSS